MFPTIAKKSATIGIAVGARMINFYFARYKKTNCPNRRAQNPCSTAGAPNFPYLENRRLRIRLLRVHSHSHGEQMFGKGGMGGDGARAGNTRANALRVAAGGSVCSRVCLRHAKRSPVKICFYYPNRPAALFQAKSGFFLPPRALSRAFHMDFSLPSSYNIAHQALI